MLCYVRDLANAGCGVAADQLMLHVIMAMTLVYHLCELILDR